jgi:acetyltransferase-like isoleucine patch superfamily enzyme
MSMALPHDWFSDPLPANCRLGGRTWLYSSFAFRHHRSESPAAVVVGEDTGLYNGTFFDLGPKAEIRIGRYCSVVGAIFCTNRRILNEVGLPGHDDSNDFGMPDLRRDLVIGDDVWIGAQAIILGDVHIGTGAIIGAAALVDQDVPPLAIFAGNPGRVVGSVSPDRSAARPS